MKRYQVTIEGMGCAHCVKSVTQALSELGAQVHNCTIGAADLSFDGDIEAVKEAVAERGFAVTGMMEA